MGCFPGLLNNIRILTIETLPEYTSKPQIVEDDDKLNLFPFVTKAIDCCETPKQVDMFYTTTLRKIHSFMLPSYLLTDKESYEDYAAIKSVVDTASKNYLDGYIELALAKNYFPIKKQELWVQYLSK